MKAFVCLVVEMAFLSSGCVVAIRLQNETWSFTWCDFRFGWISPRHFGLFRVDDRTDVSFITKKNNFYTLPINWNNVVDEINGKLKLRSSCRKNNANTNISTALILSTMVILPFLSDLHLRLFVKTHIRRNFNSN